MEFTGTFSSLESFQYSHFVFMYLKDAYARFDKLLHNIQFSPLSKPKFNNLNYNYYDSKSSKNNLAISVPSQKSNNDNKRSLSIPYRPYHPVFFNENDSTVDQLLDELNMAEEYSNDRKRSRERNFQSTDQAMAFTNSNHWERIPTVLSDDETNSFLNKKISAYSRYRDLNPKQRSSTDAMLQFHNSPTKTENEQSPKRSTATSIVIGQIHNEAPGNELSPARASFPNHQRGSSRSDHYDSPMPNSAQYNFINLNAKRKNNLSKAMISSNLNTSFLTESERLAKTDLFLLPSDGGGHLYSGMTDTSPSADCSALIQVCVFCKYFGECLEYVDNVPYSR